MTRLNVLIPTASPQNVPNFFRQVGPLVAQPDRYNVRTVATTLTWLDLYPCDVVAVPQCYDFQAVGLLKTAQSAGVKTWVDFDDYVLDVPESNPNYLEFAQPGTREAVLTAIAEADLVTVSTKEMERRLSAARPEGKKPITVVPNALHPKWPKRATMHTRSDSFLWRGSPSHLADTLQFAEAFAKGLPEEATVRLMGWFAWPLANAAFRKTEYLDYTHELPLTRYYEELASSGSSCMVVPLEDNVFNRCKSNIAQLEAIATGMLPIVPDWEEWNWVPGALTYKTPDEFADRLANFMEKPYEERQVIWEQQRLAVENFSFAAYETRWELLSQLVE